MKLTILKNQVFRFFKTYRAELIIGFILLLINIPLTWKFPPRRENYEFLILMSFLTIILLVLLFNQKRLFLKKFEEINNIIHDQFGFTSIDNEYYKRKSHFTEEKHKLAEVLVDIILPKLIDEIIQNDIQNEDSKLNKINIILDAGSTITPVFNYLIKHKITKDSHNIKLQFYTNNLAGIDELHKENIYSSGSITRDNIILIGGTPYHQYRANIGSYTQEFLINLDEREKQDKPPNKTIGIVTSNWFKGGAALETLSFAVKGKGHRDFKEKVMEISDFLIVVSPLGKILKIDDFTLLDRYSDHPNKSEKYHELKIPSNKIAKTYLLTSYRTDKTRSPFEYDFENHKFSNCKLCDENPYFEPSGKTKSEVYHIEVPHLYISRNFKKFYNQQPK